MKRYWNMPAAGLARKSLKTRGKGLAKALARRLHIDGHIPSTHHSER
jgi:hypothetical protein